MKTILPVLLQRIVCPVFKKGLVLFFFFSIQQHSTAQCGAGYTRDTINWDYMDFLHRSGSVYGGVNPVTGLNFVTTAMISPQYFGLSENRITFTNTNTLPVGGTSPFYGDVTTHTGEASTFGVGEDVKFMPAALTTYAMTFSFATAVQDVKFSVHDIDRLQRITVTALDGATAKNITMAGIGATILTITGSGTTSASAKSANSAVAVTVTTGTANVTISGSVTSFIITVSETTIVSSGPASGQDDGGFYLSDISACFANPSFPTSYYQPYTEPFTGQPAYFLANPQNLHMYMVNPATAVADWVFSDPGTVGNKMNSIAYDPINHWVYYVMDNSATAPGNLTLKKYDFTTESISTVISNIATFGLPSFTQGIEYAAAAFYNGSLYLGIEGINGSSYSTGTESVIWKIDFDGSGNATTYTEIFGYKGDDGVGAPVHDWGDFVIKDGIIISHASTINATTNHYIHYNMQTGTATIYAGNAETAGQMGQTYNGNIYRIKSNVALYNNAGGIGALTAVTVTSCSPAWSSTAGDASDPFKPKCDFGDAPATYDPVALSPAVHQQSCNNSTLRLGSAWDREWSKNTSADASGDATDEDGISTVTLMVSDGLSYNHVQDVTVLNNTGSNATLGGWLDYNANGVFDSGEGVIATVPSSASPQTITLAWTGITVAVGTPNSFLRIRLVGSGNTMTASNPTGWYSDGEIEDYPVISSATPLDIKLIDFNAIATHDKNVQLNWKAITDEDAKGFEIERSTDQSYWEKLIFVNKNSISMNTNYSYTDHQPEEGRSYYRLKMIEKNGNSKYSNIKWINIDQVKKDIRIVPNPVTNKATVIVTGISSTNAKMTIRDLSGHVVISKTINIKQGENAIPVNVSSYAPGIYILEISTPEKKYTSKIIVN